MQLPELNTQMVNRTKAHSAIHLHLNQIRDLHSIYSSAQHSHGRHHFRSFSSSSSVVFILSPSLLYKVPQLVVGQMASSKSDQL